MDITKDIWEWQKHDRRPTWDELWMIVAQIASVRSTCDRGPMQLFREHRGTGACIVSSDNRRVSVGYNGSVNGMGHCDDIGHLMVDGHCKRTIHAEENAILNATFDLVGCKIYTTTFPCYDCCKRIIQSRINEIIYLNKYGSDTDSLALLHYSKLKVRKITI